MFSTPRHAFRFGVGSALFLGSFVEAKGGRLPVYEERIFRSVNGASDRIRVPVRVIMQAGTFATVPAVAAVALLSGRRRLATVAPRFGDRRLAGCEGGEAARRKGPTRGIARRRARSRRNHGRPGLGLGAHGGRDHPRLRRRRSGAALGSPLLLAVAGITGYGRMYVGAHLPHDVVGGAGLGMMISALVPPQE